MIIYTIRPTYKVPCKNNEGDKQNQVRDSHIKYMNICVDVLCRLEIQDLIFVLLVRRILPF